MFAASLGFAFLFAASQLHTHRCGTTGPPTWETEIRLEFGRPTGDEELVDVKLIAPNKETLLQLLSRLNLKEDLKYEVDFQKLTVIDLHDNFDKPFEIRLRMLLKGSDMTYRLVGGNYEILWIHDQPKGPQPSWRFVGERVDLELFDENAIDAIAYLLMQSNTPFRVDGKFPNRSVRLRFQSVPTNAAIHYLALAIKADWIQVHGIWTLRGGLD